MYPNWQGQYGLLMQAGSNIVSIFALSQNRTLPMHVCSPAAVVAVGEGDLEIGGLAQPTSHAPPLHMPTVNPASKVGWGKGRRSQRVS